MPQVLADNALPSDLEVEEEGFWEPVHAEIEAWLAKYGRKDDAD